MRTRNEAPLRVVLFALALVAAAAITVKAIDALLVLFGGFLFALVLRGASGRLARALRIPYLACVIAIVIALLGSTVAVLLLAGPKLRDQIVALADLLPNAVHEVLERLRSASGGHPVGAGELGGANVRTFALGAVAAVGTSLGIVAGMVVIFFIGVYGAARPSDYARVVLAIVPSNRRVLALRIVRSIEHDLTRWLLGRLVAMLFVGVTSAIAFALLHLPLAMTLALFAGLLTFVEYVGALISAVPPLVIALAQSPTTAALVLVVFLLVHVIEGYVLTPMLARASVKFPPAVTLTGQVVFASLIGPLGLTFSTPLLIVIVSAVTVLRRARGTARSAKKASSHQEEQAKTDGDQHRNLDDAHLVAP